MRWLAVILGILIVVALWLRFKRDRQRRAAHLNLTIRPVPKSKE